MSSAYARTFDPDRLHKRRRAVSFSLAIAAHVLLIFLLFRIAPQLEPKKAEPPHPVTFQMLPDADNRAQPKTQAKAVTKVKQATSGKVIQPTTTPPPAAKTPPTPPVDMSLFGDRSLFASSDIGKVHNAPTEEAGEGEGSGKDSAAAYGPGEGPGGQHFYRGDWYRLPTNNELAFYLPKIVPEKGEARILCREIAHYHVENCRILGETPPGSGMARAMREASWQFLIRPPSVNGKNINNAEVEVIFCWDNLKERDTKFIRC